MKARSEQQIQSEFFRRVDELFFLRLPNLTINIIETDQGRRIGRRRAPVFAIQNEHNGEHGRQRRAMGVRSGVYDAFMPLPRGGAHGLFLEFKAGKGRESRNQQAWRDHFRSVGYTTAVCWSADEAINVVLRYLRGDS